MPIVPILYSHTYYILFTQEINFPDCQRFPITILFIYTTQLYFTETLLDLDGKLEITVKTHFTVFIPL